MDVLYLFQILATPFECNPLVGLRGVESRFKSIGQLFTSDQVVEPYFFFGGITSFDAVGVLLDLRTIHDS